MKRSFAVKRLFAIITLVPFLRLHHLHKIISAIEGKPDIIRGDLELHLFSEFTSNKSEIEILSCSIRSFAEDGEKNVFLHRLYYYWCFSSTFFGSKNYKVQLFLAPWCRGTFLELIIFSQPSIERDFCATLIIATGKVARDKPTWTARS